jgi:hypothetical protein
MARIRTIKPSFFKDEDLSDLPVIARYVFSGLWCQADRAGRLEDRPKLLKIEILPWDDADMHAILDTLAPKFITRYTIDGKKYIQINNFLKHQRPDPRDPASVIPENPATAQPPHIENTVCPPCVPVVDSVPEWEGERKEGIKPFAVAAAPPPLAIVKAKPKPDPRHGWFLRWFVWASEETTGAPYLVAKKDAGIVKTLLALGLDELVARSCYYLGLPDEQRYPRGSPTLPGLAFMANQIAGKDTSATIVAARQRGILPPEGTPLNRFTPWKVNHENQQFQAA